MDYSRKAGESVSEKAYSISYSMKSDQSIENDILDGRFRHSAVGSGNTDRSYARHGKTEYVQDYWEKHWTVSPKTDYTYARSASYNRNYDEQYTHPNMSRPSLRGDRSDESLNSRLNQSEYTDASPQSVKYHLRSRDVLDNLIPLSPGNKDSRVQETRSWTNISNTAATSKKNVLMEDKDSSPMFSSKKTFSNIYGTDGVSSTRSGLKEKRNIFVTALTTMWTIITYPITFLLKKFGSAGGKQLTKRTRTLNTPVKLTSGETSHHEVHSNLEYFQSTNFLYFLIGTIGGIIYVFRNLFTYLFGATTKSSSAIDKSVLSRTNKLRDCHLCCLPLIILMTSGLIGGGYLYACGNYPSLDQVSDYGQSTVETLHEYSLYAFETSKQVWGYLVQTKEPNDSPVETSADVPPEPTAVEHSTTPPPLPSKEPQFVPPPRSECLPGPGIQARELNERMNELKKNLEENFARKLQAFEDKANKRMYGDISSLELLKADIEKFKLEFNEKVERLKDSVSKEKLERTSMDSERSAEEVVRMERLKVTMQDSLDQFKEEVSARIEVKHREIEGRLETMGDGGRGEGEIRRSIESHLHEIFSHPSDSKLSSTLLAWLSEKFVSDEEMQRRMDSAVEKMTSDLKLTFDQKVNAKVKEDLEKLKGEVVISLDATKKEVQDEIKAVHAQWSTSTSGLSGPTVTPEQVRSAIKDALSKYDADKTGKADYALESSGGSVLGTRCSKTYKGGMAQLSIFGIPLWYANNSPRTVIQSGSLPGECWPFVGSVGFMVIQLSTKVHIKEVSLEHVNVNITTFGKVDSAPREFGVRGLADANDQQGTELGNFTYDAQGEPIQFFQISPELQALSFLHVELRIYSNHGNEEYTCLYRFRVHGSPDAEVSGRGGDGTNGVK